MMYTYADALSVAEDIAADMPDEFPDVSGLARDIWADMQAENERGGMDA